MAGTKRPEVGQQVRLRAVEWAYLPPRTPEESAEWVKWHRITAVGANLGYSHDPIWPIETDCPLLNKYLLDIAMFEVKE